MKKNARVHVANPELKKRRVLQLSRETVKTLSPHDLTQVLGGCDTTSWSTEAPPNTTAC